MDKAPIISVVMPAYNVEQYIKEAIRSILRQTHADLEFIIIDAVTLFITVIGLSLFETNVLIIIPVAAIAYGSVPYLLRNPLLIKVTGLFMHPTK